MDPFQPRWKTRTVTKLGSDERFDLSMVIWPNTINGKKDILNNINISKIVSGTKVFAYFMLWYIMSNAAIFYNYQG